QALRAPGGGDLRGPRRRRQGRNDQADHREPEPADLPGGGPGRPDRARAHPVVLPALRHPPAGRRRDRPVRPQLVQPGRRGAGDGLLHRGRVPGVPPLLPGVRAHAPALGDRPDQVLVLGLRRRAGAPVPAPHRGPDPPLEPHPPRRSPPWASSPASFGSSTPGPRTTCSPTPPPSSPPGGWWRPTTSDGPASTAS